MDLAFEASLAHGYRNPSQQIRVLSEAWVHRNLYCPACGQATLGRLGNNAPAKDFGCEACFEIFELKSKAGQFGRAVVDGAHGTMIARLESDTGPNLLLLAYDRIRQSVSNLSVIPRQFFTTSCIERRPPLKTTARRAGWVGCNILLAAIPAAGHVPIIASGEVRQKEAVLSDWASVLFLRQQQSIEARGWTVETMHAIDRLKRREFGLDDLYAMEGAFIRLYPGNRSIRPKLRQQLQVLRDAGFLTFCGRGRYRLTRAE